MSDEGRAPSESRWARQVSALLLIGLVAVIVVLDVVTDDYEVSPTILVPLLASGEQSGGRPWSAL